METDLAVRPAGREPIHRVPRDAQGLPLQPANPGARNQIQHPVLPHGGWLGRLSRSHDAHLGGSVPKEKVVVDLQTRTEGQPWCPSDHYKYQALPPRHLDTKPGGFNWIHRRFVQRLYQPWAAIQRWSVDLLLYHTDDLRRMDHGMGGLQGYIITPNSAGRRFLTPLVMNICFVGIGALILPAYVAIGIYQSILVRKTWDQYVYAMDALRVLEAGWTGGPSLALADLPGVSQVNQGWCTVQRTCAASFGFLTGIALLILFVNFGSLALLFTVRREIFTKVGHLGQHVWTNALESAEFPTDEETSQRASELERHHHPQTAPDLETFVKPTRAQIRTMAFKDAYSAETESARQIVALQKAERDLLVISWAVSQLTIAGAVISLAVTVITARYEYFSLPWPIFELLGFTVNWGFAITIIGFNICLVHNNWVGLPPPRSAPDVDDGERALGMRAIRIPGIPQRYGGEPAGDTARLDFLGGLPGRAGSEEDDEGEGESRQGTVKFI